MPTPDLAARVTAPLENDPAAVEGITWRSVTSADVDALVELGRAIAADDHPEWADTREELLEELGHSYTDLALDSLAAVTDDGTVAAWGLVVMPSTHDTLVRVILLGGVAPAYRDRGIGRALLAWQHGRARQRLAASGSALPGWVIVPADERAPSAARILERAGFVPMRYFHNLTRRTDERPERSADPDGFRIVGYTPDRSLAAHRVRDSAFLGEGSSQPMSDEQWDSMTALSTAAPEFSFLALDDEDQVVGLLMTLTVEDDDAGQGPASGYVWVLGVAPRSRRRGVARSLLLAHLRALHDAGIERSTLDVASDGPDSGLELFTGLGYRRNSLSVNHTRVY